MRRYTKEDHGEVCRIFYQGVMEAWLPSYRCSSTTCSLHSCRRLVTGRAPLAAMVQGLLLATLHSLTPSFLWFLMAVVVLQMLVMVAMFYVHWGYCWEHLNSDLGDRELKDWMCQGQDKAGFYVAEEEGKVVGMVAYSREVMPLSLYMTRREAGWR